MDDKMQTAIGKVRTPQDIMDFFDSFISYGCIDLDGVRYIDSLGGNDFRAKYRTLSLQDTLKFKIGACIEQTNVTKYLLDTIDIEGRMFCTMGYNEEHNAPDDLYLVHCFTLANFDNKILNIEHSDSELCGIYSYDTIEEAIIKTHQLFSNKFIAHGATHTVLAEYKDFIEGGLSFAEFGKYINSVATKITN